jgi:hypothetical protein
MNLSFGDSLNLASTIGAGQRRTEKLDSGHTSERVNTSKLTDLVAQMANGRTSKVTLALLLNTHLAVSQRAARTSALARLEHATVGLSSALRDFERRASICVSLYEPASTFHLWLTQYATVHGFLLGSGANPHDWSSTRAKVEEIRRTSAGQNLIDVDAFTTKVERARTLTRLVLGDGRYRAGTSVGTLSDLIWRVETDLRNGFRPTYKDGSAIEEYSPPGKPVSRGNRPYLSGWTQMTLDDLNGSERP